MNNFKNSCLISVDGITEKMTSDSEFDFLPAAGQMKLTEIQKAQIKRVRESAMEELKSVLARVRLALDEYTRAENELQIIESPDPELEAEEEERKMRERKMKRKNRRAKRKIERPAKEEKKDDDDDEKGNGRNMQIEAPDQTKTSGIEEKDGELGTSPESYGDSSGSSTDEDKDNEDEDADERETQQETWTVPGLAQRKISQKTLLKVSDKIRGAF